MPRNPAVAGMFYEADAEGLARSIERGFLGRFGPGKLPEPPEHRSGRVLGLVCPHAGYVYSGGAAACAFDALASDGIPDTVVLIGPNHRGAGTAAAIDLEPEWATPLGTIETDVETAQAILSRSQYTAHDDRAHIGEHSLEVQIPFLQYISRSARAVPPRIVPITIAYLRASDALALTQDLGSAIAEAIRGKSAVVLASSDFTHYESKSAAQARDALVIEQILKLDPEGLLRTVHTQSISMCGPVPVAVMLTACKSLGAANAQMLTYYTSGDVTGDTEQVVGYGALVVLNR